MRRAEALLRHRAVVLAAWLVATVAAALTAARLPGVLQGGTDAIPGTGSDRVTRVLREEFGAGTLYQFTVVLHSDSVGTDDPRFGGTVERVSAALAAHPRVSRVETAWNTPRDELLGADGRSALVLVTPRVTTFFEAERLTPSLRAAIAAARPDPAVAAQVTGSTAMLHDLDENSSSDLLAAERIGLPLTLLVLLAVFGAPIAALLPLLLALAATVLGLAGLFALSGWRPVSVFAENVVSMIGLGVGVDYSLFVLGRFREAQARGLGAREAAAEAVRAAGHTVVFSGATVALGFLALFLVRAPFLHTIALGGVFVVAAAVAAAMTLLPALLATLGGAVNWPRRPRPAGADGSGFWWRWAALLMRRPWAFLALALAVLAVFIAPVFRMRAWNIGPGDLPVGTESRRGYDALEGRFARGWTGPIVMLVQAPAGASVFDAERRRALIEIAGELRSDPRSGQILGLPGIFARAGGLGPGLESVEDLPEAVREAARRVVSADQRTAIAVLVTDGEAGDPATMAYLAELRARRWPRAEAAGLTVSWGGASAVMADFDAELFGSLPRVVIAVVLSTFLVLALLFRSLAVPLKATLLNVASVLAAYGFLVLVFQDGLGARWIGLEPPGGLNSFIVLMLFTILFGLSMDYEVFLLARVREEHAAGADNEAAVRAGLARTGGTITSAALIMVSIFAAFGFTRLVPTREFGLGLAFAVALDATLIRVVLVPVLMKLAGRWNWWWPFGWAPAKRAAVNE